MLCPPPQAKFGARGNRLIGWEVALAWNLDSGFHYTIQRLHTNLHAPPFPQKQVWCGGEIGDFEGELAGIEVCAKMLFFSSPSDHLRANQLTGGTLLRGNSWRKILLSPLALSLLGERGGGEGAELKHAVA